MPKDIIVFVNAIRPATFQALKTFEEAHERSFTPVVLVDKAIKDSIFHQNGQHALPKEIRTIEADFNDAQSVRKALSPIEDRIYAVTSQYENSVHELRKLIPYLPYIPMPTEQSLDWSTEKKQMRQLLGAYDPSLVPGYMEATDSSDATIARIEAAMTYPLIVKPSGPEGSLLVSFVPDKASLRETLDRTFEAMQAAYDTWIKWQKPAVLVEEFMEGDMYSIDTYVNHSGECFHTPLVRVITGRNVGFDDFFGYSIKSPVDISQKEAVAAEDAATRACHAVGLRSVTAHIELMHTPQGWKIIELGPRIGGFRHDIYNHAYGINHIVNDIRNRAGEVPDIPRDIKKYAATFDIYPRQEGVLDSVDGVDAVKSLPSYVYLRQDIFPGNKVKFAKNNGDPVINLMLSHASKEQFEADVVAMERQLVLGVKSA